jgi:hypothetical protein
MEVSNFTLLPLYPEKEPGTHCVRSRHALGPGGPVAIAYGGAAVDGRPLANSTLSTTYSHWLERGSNPELSP